MAVLPLLFLYMYIITYYLRRHPNKVSHPQPEVTVK